MKTVFAHLQLSGNTSSRTRDRCPTVVFSKDGVQIASIRTDVEKPEIPLPDGHVDEFVIHDDAVSRTIDEEAWLLEFARVIAPGGKLRLTLPAEGMFAWLDTMNAYRYLADISGRGKSPDAALPTGWNRHYTRDHIHALLTDAGFTRPVIASQNTVLNELGLLSGMLWANWIHSDRFAEQKLFPRFGKRDPRESSPLPATTWSITAHR